MRHRLRVRLLIRLLQRQQDLKLPLLLLRLAEDVAAGEEAIAGRLVGGVMRAVVALTHAGCFCALSLLIRSSLRCAS